MAPWNHNLQYHDLVLKAVPANCDRALDVGCGQGLLARRLAQQCKEVTAIDADQDVLGRAMASGVDSRVTFLEADAMNYPFPEASFDLITAVATLHHLPLKPALMRFKRLLRPGGVLAVIGLYRNSTLTDYAFAGVALPISKAVRLCRGEAAVGAPIREPEETLGEIRSVCEEVLPGAAIQRHLFFRYSLFWHKAGGLGGSSYRRS